MGADKRVAEDHERGWGILSWNFCFEMVHYGAYVTKFLDTF